MKINKSCKYKIFLHNVFSIATKRKIKLSFRQKKIGHLNVY